MSCSPYEDFQRINNSLSINDEIIINADGSLDIQYSTLTDECEGDAADEFIESFYASRLTLLKEIYKKRCMQKQ